MSYDSDFYAWTQEQADLLRRRAINEGEAGIDWENVAEETSCLGRRDKQEVRKRLARLLVCLLRWQFQPERRCRKWKSAIAEQRYRIAGLIAESPSLAEYPAKELADAYRSAANLSAIRRMELYHLPETCEWSAEQVLDIEFWPT